jgi:hypothetical protein
VAAETPSGGDDRERLAPEDRALFERLAQWLVDRRLSVPAVLFIESAKPLSFVGSQAMYFFEPMVKTFLSGKDYTRLARLLEDRDNVDAFLRIVEDREEQAREKEREEKRRAKDEKRSPDGKRAGETKEPR